MNNVLSNQDGQTNFKRVIQKTCTNLVVLKKSKDEEKFNQELLNILPFVNKYVANRLNEAILNGKLNKGMYSPNDFTDQLFIEVYEHIDEISNESDLYSYIFKRVNELLEDSLVEEEFDHVFFDTIETYSQPEWDTMEETYTTDGDGDFVMVEELEDSNYTNPEYTLNHVFIADDEKELMAKLDAKLGKERIDRHIEFLIHKMGTSMRSVFQLYTQQGFTLAEIATIRKMPLDEVEELLSKARKILKDSFAKRFLIESN